MPAGCFGAKRLPDVTSSEYFQRLAGEPLESAVRERVGGAPGRKVTAERIPQPAGKIRYEARIDGVGGKIIEHVFVDLKDVLMRGTDARLIHHGERGNDLRLLRYTTPARNGEVRVTLTSRELGGQPADESTKWLLKVEASEWAKGEGKGTPSLVRVERDGGRLQLYLDGAPLSRDEVLVRLDALAKGDPGFQVHVEGDVVPPDQPHVMELMKAIGRTAVGDQNVKFPSHITQQIMENAKNEVRLIFDQRGANPGVEQVLEIPGVLTTRDSAEMMRRIEAMVAENPRLVVVLDIGDGVNPGHMPTIDVLRRHLAATGASVKDGPRLAAIARRQREVVENAVLRTKRMNDLKQVGLALHGFHDTRKFFPPGAVEHNPRWFGENGSPKLSWRVHLLPYLEQKALYDKFHLDEPWDSENNKALLDQMPPQFKTTDDPTKTTFLAVVGEETAYEGKAGLTMDEIDEGDGRDNTAYVVDAGRERAVPWTKPEDLPFDKEDPIRAFGTSDFGDVFLALMADASVKSIPYDTAPESLRALFTRAAGDTFDETAKRTTPLPKNVGPRKLSPPAEITLDATLEGADDSLSRVVYSRDGRHVLAASGTQVFRWETASGELVNTYQLGDKKLDVIAVTGNPNHLVTTDRGYRVRLWDLTTEKVVQEFEPHEDLTIALVVSPDDRFVLSGCDGGVVRLSDLATGKKLHQSTGGFCRVVSFSADGTRIAVGSQFHVMVMDVESWTKLKDFRVTRTASARAAELSPDGRMTVTGTDSGSVMLWDVATGKQVHLASLPAPVRSCAFLPDGRHFVAGCEDKTLRVWNTQSGEEKFKVTAENHTTHWLAVSPDGKMIATGGGQFSANPDFFKYEFDGDANVYLWQLPESVWPEVRADDISLERKFGGRVPVKTLAFLPNGDALTAAGGTVPELHVWDLKAGRVEVAIPIPFDIRTAAVSADLKFVLVAENNKGQGTYRVARYDLDVFTLPPDEFSKQAEKVWVQSLIPPNRKSYEILQVKLEPAWTINLEQAPDELTCFHNGDAFLVRDPRGRVALYRSEDGGFVSELAAENAEAMSLAPDGRLLFLKFKQGAAHLIRADNGSKVNELKIAPTSRVTSSCWCADGRCVVTGDASGRIQVWNLATGEPVHSFPTGDDPIVNVLIDTGRQRIYSSNHRGVSVWDLNGRLLARGEAPTFQEGSLALSPDGKLLLSGGQSWTNDGSAGKGDHSLRLWQLPESVWPQE